MELLEIKDSLHAFIERTFLAPIGAIPEQLGPARITALCYALSKTSDLLMVMLLAMEIREMETVPAVEAAEIDLLTYTQVVRIKELMQR